MDYSMHPFFYRLILMINNFKRFLDNFEIVISATFLCITVLVVIVNVGMRYLLQSGGLYWAEEVSTTCFIWSVFIGAAAAYRYKMHIGLDFITRMGPLAFRKILAVIIDGLMVGINGYIVYLSTLFIQQNGLKRTPVLDIPAIYVNLALSTGFTLITLHALCFLYKDLCVLFSSNTDQEPSPCKEQ